MPAPCAACSLSWKNARTRAQMSPPVVAGSITMQPQPDPATAASISGPKPVTSLITDAPASKAFRATQG